MKNPRPFSTVPLPSSRSTLRALSVMGLLTAVGSAGMQTIGLPGAIAPSVSTEQALAAPAQPRAAFNDNAGKADVVMAEPSLTDAAAIALVDLSKPAAAVEALPVNPADEPPPPSAPVRLASVNPSALELEGSSSVPRATENEAECLMADLCVDRYLWALYQRTPKEDTIKEYERRKVAIKRRGKMVTVVRTFTKLIDEDFGWKDPKAADHAGMPMMEYVIGGMDRSFKLKLFRLLRSAEAEGLSPGITSAFRDDYRQSIATGLKAATNRSFHGGSSRGGYGHGLAADIVSVDGATRDQRWASSERLWKWVDARGNEFGIARPYLGRDPPHVAPIDGQEYAAHSRGTKQATAKVKHLAKRDDGRGAKRPRVAAAAKMKAS